MDETAGVLVEIGGLLLLLGLLGRLAAVVRISPIPLYLLAGLALGAIDAGPITFDEEIIEIGASVGIALLLFMLGLEYAADQLPAAMRGGAGAAVFDLVSNMLPGAAIALLLGWGWEAALILGGVTYISSSGVFAKVVEDLDRRAHPETAAITSLLVIEDLVMAAYLPLVAVLVTGAGVATGLLSATMAATGAAIALAVAIRPPSVLVRALSPRSEEAFLLIVFGAVLVIAGLAETIQLSAAVGAFLVGMAMSGPVVTRAREVLTPLRDLFAAAFFVFFGLEVDFGGAGAIAGPLIALVLITSVSKVLTGWWAARAAGVDVAGRRRAASVLIARGEFSIVIAGIGVAAGVEPDLGPLAALYVLTTAITGSLLTRFFE